MSPLAQRFLTAATLVPLLVAGILWLPTGPLAGVLGVFVVAGAWEWAGLCGLRSGWARLGYAAGVAASLVIALPYVTAPAVVLLIDGVALAWWLVALLLVLAHQAGHGPPLGGTWLRAATGVLVLVPAWLSLCALRALDPAGPYLLLALLFLIWSADSAAFFVGRRWGRTRLASRVSPGKSWEGVAGALVAVLPLALLAVWLLPASSLSTAGFVLLCAATVLASILGDLVESLYKRQAGLKDSGALLPGHGGVLDRIDSLTAAAPLYASGVILLERLR